MKHNLEFRREIKRTARAWAVPMGLESWTITHKFYGRRWPYAKGVAAQTTTSWKYMTATMAWNLPACEGRDDIESIVVHELAHVLTSEWDFKSGDDRKGSEPCGMERVATLVSKALIRVRDSSGAPR